MAAKNGGGLQMSDGKKKRAVKCGFFFTKKLSFFITATLSNSKRAKMSF